MRVEGVELVQVDGLHAQPAQRRVEGVAQMAARQADAVGVLRHGKASLGGDHHLVAHAGPGGKPLADDLLAGAAGVDVGGVDEVAAGVEIAVQDGV